MTDQEAQKSATSDRAAADGPDPLTARIATLEKTVAYLLHHSQYNDERRAGYSHAEAAYRVRVMFRLDDDVEV